MIIPQLIFSATADWLLDHLEVLELMSNNPRVIPVMSALGHAGMGCGWVWQRPLPDPGAQSNYGTSHVMPQTCQWGGQWPEEFLNEMGILFTY